MGILKGQVWKLGHDIDTDLIIAARYLNRSEPEYLASHCLEDLIPQLQKRIKPQDILVAGRNFGCGSSREHAPIAILHAGFSCIIAENFARIFYRNAINIGLPVIVSAQASQRVSEGDCLEVDPERGLIFNKTTKEEYRGEPFPSFIQEILAGGGLIPYVAEKVKKRG